MRFYVNLALPYRLWSGSRLWNAPRARGDALFLKDKIRLFCFVLAVALAVHWIGAWLRVAVALAFALFWLWRLGKGAMFSTLQDPHMFDRFLQR